jgi:hypothetical protein
MYLNYFAMRLPARTATSTTATAAAAASTAATTTAGRFRTSFIYIQRTAVHFRPIELCDSRFGIAPFRHLHERKTAGLTAVPVRYDINALHPSVLGKRLLKVFLRGLVAQITDKNICHSLNSSFIQ